MSASSRDYLAIAREHLARTRTGVEATPEATPVAAHWAGGWIAPAVCRCGEVTAPFLLIRPDGSRAVLCPRGHFTPARRDRDGTAGPAPSTGGAA